MLTPYRLSREFIRAAKRAERQRAALRPARQHRPIENVGGHYAPMPR